jgi:hypothetical protein
MLGLPSREQFFKSIGETGAPPPPPPPRCMAALLHEHHAHPVARPFASDGLQRRPRWSTGRGSRRRRTRSWRRCSGCTRAWTCPGQTSPCLRSGRERAWRRAWTSRRHWCPPPPVLNCKNRERPSHFRSEGGGAPRRSRLLSPFQCELEARNNRGCAQCLDGAIGANTYLRAPLWHAFVDRSIGMDLQQLVAAVTGCLSPDASIRQAAEGALQQVRRRRPHAPRQVRIPPACVRACEAHLRPACALQCRHSPGQIGNLLRVALEESLDLAIRQVAAIAFKNVVKKAWESRGERQRGLPRLRYTSQPSAAHLQAPPSRARRARRRSPPRPARPQKTSPARWRRPTKRRSGTCS